MPKLQNYIVIRSLKIALAVMICMVIFHFSDRGAPIVASLAAVAPLMAGRLHATINQGKATLLGNVIGGSMALLYFGVTELIQKNFTVEVLLLPIFIIFVVLACEALHDHRGIVSAISTTVLLCLGVSYGEPFALAMSRVVDTFIGTCVAVGINAMIRPTESEIKGMIADDRKELANRERDLASLQEKLKQK